MPTLPTIGRDPAPPTPTDAADASAGDGSAAPRRLLSADLLRGARELLIAHGAVVYRLRVTAQCKLILTK